MPVHELAAAGAQIFGGQLAPLRHGKFIQRGQAGDKGMRAPWLSLARDQGRQRPRHGVCYLNGRAVAIRPFLHGPRGRGALFPHDMADIGARAPARLQQALGDQTFNRVDNGRSGHRQVLCQRAAGRQALARLQALAQDDCAQAHIDLGAYLFV